MCACLRVCVLLLIVSFWCVWSGEGGHVLQEFISDFIETGQYLDTACFCFVFVLGFLCVFLFFVLFCFFFCVLFFFFFWGGVHLHFVPFKTEGGGSLSHRLKIQCVSCPTQTLQFVQLVQAVDRDTAETTILWLTLVHSLLVPHVLWALSRRYRHALSYTWTVHVLRDESAKEEGRHLTAFLYCWLRERERERERELSGGK